MNDTKQTTLIKEELLETHITLEKLKLVQKGILKDAAIIGGIGVLVILFGVYVQYAEWTTYPIIPFLIFASGVLLAIALRPLQQFKEEKGTIEKQRISLEEVLKKENLGYEAVVKVSKDIKGEYIIKKSIKLFTLL